MDDATEQSRLLDRIAARVMPELNRKIGEAYLRGLPFMLRYGADGITAEIIPADQFYFTPDSPTERT